MTIRTVVFDLGHTLWDIGPQRGQLEAAYAAARETLRLRLGRDNLPAGAVLQRAVRDVLHQANETYFMDGAQLEQPPSTEWIDRACRRLGLDLDAALLREITPPLFATEIECLTCHEGTLEAVQSLDAAGYALGCVTNTLADTATIRAMLRLHGFESLIRSVVVSADEGWRKPHPSLFQKALAELRTDAASAVFVGDSPLHDISGAQAVGMKAILTRQYVTRPLGPHDAQPDATITHLRELVTLLDGWNRRD